MCPMADASVAWYGLSLKSYNCPKCKDIVWFNDGKTVRKDVLFEMYQRTDVGYCSSRSRFIWDGRDTCDICGEPHRTFDVELQFASDMSAWNQQR